MPSYFLPMKAGSKKNWGSKAHDFWCCHGTMVQAHTIYPQLCWYEDPKHNRLIVGQYINSEYRYNENVTITQLTDMKYYGNQTFFDEHDESSTSRWFIKFHITADKPETFTLSLRIPKWVHGKPVIKINTEEAQAAEAVNGYYDINRTWNNDTISIFFPAAVTMSSLPDQSQLTSFLEGPIVLAGQTEKDCGIYMENSNLKTALTHVTEHTYSTFPWQQSNYRTINQPANFDFVPLYEITDDRYTLYFTKKTLH